jgi:hypothetical protein
MKIARESESQQLSPNALAQFRQMAVGVAQRLEMAGEYRTAGVVAGPRFE